MNNNLDKKSELVLIPGLFRQESDGVIKIKYTWISGLGGLKNKLSEFFIFTLGFVFMIFPILGVNKIITGKSNFVETAMVLLFFLLGFVLVYRGLSFVFNRSVFEVTDQGLTVRHSPLPFPGAASIRLQNAEISSVEWRKVGHSRNSSDIHGFSQAGYSATFDVILNTNQGKTHTLLSGIQAREYAFAIASEISKNLHK